MTPFQGIIAAVAAIVLFLQALQGFSREVQAVGGAALKSWLPRVTESRWRGFLIGAVATAVVQSSSAITALAVSLVDAGVISFRGSLGIVLGANVGTTATAWLVSFKLTGIGPFFIVLGALLSALPGSRKRHRQGRVLLRTGVLRAGSHLGGAQAPAGATVVPGTGWPWRRRR